MFTGIGYANSNIINTFELQNLVFVKYAIDTLLVICMFFRCFNGITTNQVKQRSQ